VVPGVVKVDVATFQSIGRQGAEGGERNACRWPRRAVGDGRGQGGRGREGRSGGVCVDRTEMAEASWLLVLAFTLEASDVEAARIEESCCH